MKVGKAAGFYETQREMLKDLDGILWLTRVCSRSHCHLEIPKCWLTGGSSLCTREKGGKTRAHGPFPSLSVVEKGMPNALKKDAKRKLNPIWWIFSEIFVLAVAPKTKSSFFNIFLRNLASMRKMFMFALSTSKRRATEFFYKRSGSVATVRC